jgi:hypothetical protein
MGAVSPLAGFPVSPPEEERDDAAPWFDRRPQSDRTLQSDRAPWSDPTLCGPPRGHPERLVCDVPPSRAERALWAQLAGLRTVGRSPGRGTAGGTGEDAVSGTGDGRPHAEDTD